MTLQEQGPAAMDHIVELLTKAGQLLGTDVRNIEDMARHGQVHRIPNEGQYRCGNTLIVLEAVATLDVNFLVWKDGTPSYGVTSYFRFHTNEDQLRETDHGRMVLYAHEVGVSMVEHTAWRKSPARSSVTTLLEWTTKGPDLTLLLGPHVEFLHLCLGIRAKA